MGTHALAPGTVLGRYELLMPIAQGGMATVWAARQRGSRGFSKTVAVKTILPNLSDDPQFEQMFLDEAAIASKIHHPNVAEIYDLGEQDEVLYLVMEWVDGESLSTLSKHARKNGTDIPLRVGLKIIAQAAAGLHAAHELRDDDDGLLMLVHRDVSPQNILVSPTGGAKIVDFGVAKALGRAGETSAGQLKGKVPFMSPEQAKGGTVDRRTDIFALGIILYRIATSHHPFLDEDDIKTLRNIITRPVMPPRVKNPSVSVDLERVILRALQKDPAKRYATALELATELEAVIAKTGGPVSVDEIATFVRSTLGERDRKRRAALRDAALKIDEHGGVPSGAEIRLSAPDSVSGVMLTKTATPPELKAERAAATAPAGRPPKSDPLAAPSPESSPLSSADPSPSSAQPLSSGDPRLVSSPTLVAMASTQGGSRGAARGIKLAALSLGVVAVVGGAVFAFTREAPPAVTTATAAAARTAAPVATALPTPTSEPAAATGTSVAFDDLPDDDADKDPKGKGTTRRSSAGTKATATATAVATAAPTAPTPPTSKPVVAPNVPAVTDPGF
jgi:serine/threonine-protein kinase